MKSTIPEVTNRTLAILESLDSSLSTEEKAVLRAHMEKMHVEPTDDSKIPSKGSDLDKVKAARASLSHEQFEAFRKHMETLPAELKTKIAAVFQAKKGN